MIDAAAQGAGDGLHLALNIGGHADRVSGADRAWCNGILGWVHAADMAWFPASMQQILG